MQNVVQIVVKRMEIFKGPFKVPRFLRTFPCTIFSFQVVRRGGDLNTTILVDYHTEDGTANASSDYEPAEGTITFRPGETLHTVKVAIIDDDIFEEDEYFRVKIQNVRILNSENSAEPRARASRLARIEPPSIATIVILDDDHAGVFSFPDSPITVSSRKLRQYG